MIAKTMVPASFLIPIHAKAKTVAIKLIGTMVLYHLRICIGRNRLVAPDYRREDNPEYEYRGDPNGNVSQHNEKSCTSHDRHSTEKLRFPKDSMLQIQQRARECALPLPAWAY
jgi:hypothetical protein